MSSYSDLATAIIQKNGQGGKFSGLNTALDLRQAFKDAATQFAYQQQLAKEQGRNAGYASIISNANINGVDPQPGLTQLNQAINNGGNLPSNNGASALASGSSPTPPAVSTPTTSSATSTASSATPTDNSGRNEDYLNTSNLTSKRKALIKNIANYQGDPSQLYRGNAGRELASQVASYDPNFDASNYANKKSFIQTNWNKGPLFQNRQAAENSVQHLGLLKDNFDKMNNGELLIANAAGNAVKIQTGNSQVTNAMIAAKANGTEMAKLLRGGGLLNEKEQLDTQSQLNTAASPEQMHGAIDTMLNLAKPRINSGLEMYKTTMGKYPTGAYSPEFWDALKYVSPSVYNELAPKGNMPTIDGGNQSSQGGQTNTQTYTEGQTATNPQTGHTITYKGGKWQ